MAAPTSRIATGRGPQVEGNRCRGHQEAHRLNPMLRNGQAADEGFHHGRLPGANFTVQNATPSKLLRLTNQEVHQRC